MPKSLNDLIPEKKVLNADHVIDAYQFAKQQPAGVARDRAMQTVRKLADRFNSHHRKLRNH